MVDLLQQLDRVEVGGHCSLKFGMSGLLTILE